MKYLHQQSTIDRIYEPVKTDLLKVEEQLTGLASNSHESLAGLVKHIAEIPGKRMRPALALLASKFHDAEGQSHVVMATAVELLHIASLVHDDTVDNSPLRRGAATASNLWGDNIAVLVGDYLFAASAVFVADTNNIRVIRRFSETIMELSTGQLLERFSAFKWTSTIEDYKNRIHNKTASLFRTAAESGAILSGAPETTVQSLTKYGYDLGMAFQIVDDILDFEGTEEEVGKPVGHDLLEGTLTMPAMLLLERYPDNNPIIKLFNGEEPKANHQLALAMIHNSNIIEDSYSVARGYCERAARELEGLPNSTERRSLLELINYVTERSR